MWLNAIETGWNIVADSSDWLAIGWTSITRLHPPIVTAQNPSAIDVIATKWQRSYPWYFGFWIVGISGDTLTFFN